MPFTSCCAGSVYIKRTDPTLDTVAIDDADLTARTLYHDELDHDADLPLNDLDRHVEIGDMF